MTQMDEEVLAEALRQTFPRVIFLEEDPWWDPTDPSRDSISDIDSPVARVAVPDSPSWAPAIKRSPEFPRRYTWVDPPPRALHIVRSYWEWHPGLTAEDSKRFAFDPPTLSVGQIGALWDDNDPRNAGVPAFIRQVWRIIARITTNKLKSGTPLMNELMSGSDRLLMSESKGGDYWAGHHALEWCASGGPRRMLAGGFRACDDWAPPRDPWYQDLRRRVEERYGRDFGNPPPHPD
jgi:hypothetical protein